MMGRQAEFWGMLVTRVTACDMSFGLIWKAVEIAAVWGGEAAGWTIRRWAASVAIHGEVSWLLGLLVLAGRRHGVRVSDRGSG